VEVKPSKHSLSDNEYVVEFEPELLGEDSKDKKIVFPIEERNATPFEKTRFLNAVAHYKDQGFHLGKAHEEYISMLKELYPENYKKKDERSDEKADKKVDKVV